MGKKTRSTSVATPTVATNHEQRGDVDPEEEGVPHLSTASPRWVKRRRFFTLCECWLHELKRASGIEINGVFYALLYK